MPCNDGRPDLRELYRLNQKRLDELTDLMCRTMKDAEERGLLLQLRGDAQEWWKHHKIEDARRGSKERGVNAIDRFLLLSTNEQEELLKSRT